MSDCCDPYSAVFSPKQGKRDLRRYRKKGLDRLATEIVAQLRPTAPGSTVLEVGGGIGAMCVELVRAGATSAVNVEASEGYRIAASELVAEAGLSERVRMVQGDFTERAPEIEAADLVLMNRVVCCYPAMEALVGAASDRTRRSLALVYPRDRWFMRVLRRAIAMMMAVRRNSFRFFVHDPRAIDEVLEAKGLARAFMRQTAGWEAVIAQRV